MMLGFLGVILHPTAHGLDRNFRKYCFADAGQVTSVLGERYEWMTTYALDRFRSPNVRSTMRRLMPWLSSPIPPADLDRITVPVTLIWGRHDVGVPLQVAESASARYGWPLHVIEDARDDPALEQPHAFLAAVHEALAPRVPCRSPRGTHSLTGSPDRRHAMSTQTRPALRVGVVVIAPAMLLATLSYHPYLPGRQPNLEALAAAVTAGPTRWGVVHLATGVASAVLLLAFLAIRAHLHEAGEDHWSAAALPFIVIGCTLYAMLPAMEFAPLAAIEAGGDVSAAQEALLPWFIPLLVAGGITFAIASPSEPSALPLLWSAAAC